MNEAVSLGAHVHEDAEGGDATHLHLGSLGEGLDVEAHGTSYGALGSL